MRSKLTIALLLLLPLISDAQYTWQALPAAPTSWRFDDFYFVNPQMGWAINPNYNYLTPNQFGRIFKTTDGGNTWQKMDSSHTFYRCVGFADTLNGWVGNIADTTVYMGHPFTTDTIPLYETHDGGTTWAPVALPHPHPAGICGISVVTDSIIYAYGRFFGPAGYVKTTDKGTSWIYTDMTSQALGLIDGKFFNKDTGFITGAGTDYKAQILYTVNGGTTWTPVYHSTRADTDRVWKIFFPSRYIGYATIEYGGSDDPYNTVFLKTTDGGLNWTEHTFFSTYDEEGVGFINDTVGWIGGDYATGTYVTHDGGTTWAIDASFGVLTPPYVVGAHGYYINRFRVFGDSLMYASGNTIYKMASTEKVAGLSANPYNVENYPNPFNNQTTIAYTLPYAADNIVLEIHDLIGQKVFTKNLGSQSSGNHQYIFNEQLPGGIYYYTISSNTFRSIKKMVIK